MSYKASVIIPVYNAEQTVVKCVESLVYGKERSIQVILVDDCSKDESWVICQKLAEQYRNVLAVQNDRNSGVSYTRNHGLEVAESEYILFMDSDDWGSSEFASELIYAAQNHPRKMVMCGFHFLDYLYNSSRDYLWEDCGTSEFTITQEQYFELVNKTLIQFVWNKAFRLDIIRQHNLSFDVNQSMGEDFRFVLDYMKAAEVEICLIVNRPLYYYIRASKTSLMSKFGLTKQNAEYQRYHQLWLLTACQDKTKNQYLKAIESAKETRCYQIVHSDLNKQEKLQAIEATMQDGMAQRYYRSQQKIANKEKAYQWIQRSLMLRDRVKWRLLRVRRDRIIRNAKVQLKTDEFTIISQNCIGGVFYHDMGIQFQSPTINLYFSAVDFVKFVLNLKEYLSMTPEMMWDETYPVGLVGDIKINFMHYRTCTEALKAWEKRKKRVRWDRIVVLSTDMEGFNEGVFEQWKQIPFPKVLFTAQKRFANEPDSVYYPIYEQNNMIPDLIPNREFYKDGKVVAAINHFN